MRTLEIIAIIVAYFGTSWVNSGDYPSIDENLVSLWDAANRCS
jgi:hypothetical protein